MKLLLPPSLLARLQFRLRLLPWVILVVGALLSWNAYRQAQTRVTEAAATRFQTRAHELISGLSRRLDANADMLRGVAGLFASSEQVTRQEFATYVEALQLGRYYPGIQGVGYSERLAPPAFAGKPAPPSSSATPTQPRATGGEHQTTTSILYLEPPDWRNQRALGFDMYSEPVRQEAMRRAALGGAVALSGPVTLVQETDQDVQPGILMYTPIYDRTRPSHTPEQRWEALVGWAYSPLRMRDLINAFLREEVQDGSQKVVLRVFAGGRSDPDLLVYGPPDNPDHDAALPRVVRQLPLYGSQWLVVLEPLQADWAAATTTDDTRAVLLSGLALTLLLATLVAVMTRSHRQVSAALADAVQANERLAQSEATLRLAGTVMDASVSAILVTDAERRIVMVNPAFSRITGYSREDALGKAAHMLASETQDPAFYRQLWGEVQDQGLWEGELQSRRKNGELFPAELSITRVQDPNGIVSHYVGMFTDITARRRVEERVRFLAHHDYLTGLPNRALLVDRAAQELASARRYGRRPALLFLDLDRFKPINDTYGHEAGDAMLRSVATRLRDELRESDLVCRQGGDEFVVLLPDHVDQTGLEQLARKLLEAIERPHEVAGIELQVSACIGIATFPQNGETVDALIQSADAAMYLAKSHPEIKVRFAPATTG